MGLNVVSAENLNEPHVLLVDDDPVVLEQMAVLLENREYRVTCSTTGFEAGILLKEYPQTFDVVLDNHSKTGMSRISSTVSAHNPFGDAPVVLHIDMNRFINGNRLSQSCFTDIADRPFNIDELDSIIKKVIN